MTDHYDPPGLNFEANGRQMKYCYPDCPRESLRGWLLYKHPDGQWVTLRKATDADITAINDAVVSAHHGEDKMKPFSFPITSLRINGATIEGCGEMRIHETEDTSIGWRGNVLMAPALRVYKGEFRPFDHAGREALCEAYKSRKTLIASMSAVNCEVLITGMGPKEPGMESVEFKLQSVSEPK